MAGGKACLEVGTGLLEPAGHLNESQDRALGGLLAEAAEGFEVDVEPLATEVVASAGGDNEGVVGQAGAHEGVGYLEDAGTAGLTLASEGGATGHEVGLETVGKHDVGGLVEQLGALAGGEVADGGEAVGTVGGLFLDAVLGLHVELGGHLVAMVAVEVLIEQLVVAGYGAAYAGGVGGEKGGHAGQVVLEKEHAEAGHPLVGLVDDAGRGGQALAADARGELPGGVGEHGGFVVVAVTMERVYLKVFPSAGVDFVFLCEVGLEVDKQRHGPAGYAPAADAYADACGCGRFLPVSKEFGVFLEKGGVAGSLSQVGPDEADLVGKCFLQCLGSGGEHGVDASDLVANLPTCLEDEIGD